MAEFNLDINSILNRAFGINRGRPFDPGQAQQPAIRQEQKYDDLPTSTDDEGTEFVQVRNSLNASLPTGQPLFMPMKLGDVLLPNEPTVIINSRKNIVE